MPGKGRPFQAGNKFGKGRPRGGRNRQTMLRAALDSDAEEIISMVKQLALNGDRMALKMCVERLIAPAKTPNSRFRLPRVDTAASLTPALSALTRAVGRGRLSAQEGESMAKIIESQRRTLETEEIEARVRALEKVQTGRGRYQR